MIIIPRTVVVRAQSQLLYFSTIAGEINPVGGQLMVEHGTFIMPSKYTAGGFQIDFGDIFKKIKYFDATYISGLPKYLPERFEWSAVNALVTIIIKELKIDVNNNQDLTMIEPIGQDRSAGVARFQAVGW